MDQKKYCKEIFLKIDKIWLDTFDYILFIKKKTPKRAFPRRFFR